MFPLICRIYVHPCFHLLGSWFCLVESEVVDSSCVFLHALLTCNVNTWSYITLKPNLLCNCNSRDQWKMNGSIEAANSTPASPHAKSLFLADPAAAHSPWLFNENDDPPTWKGGDKHFELIKKKIQSVSNRKEKASSMWVCLFREG